MLFEHPYQPVFWALGTGQWTRPTRPLTSIAPIGDCGCLGELRNKVGSGRHLAQGTKSIMWTLLLLLSLHLSYNLRARSCAKAVGSSGLTSPVSHVPQAGGAKRAFEATSFPSRCADRKSEAQSREESRLR